MMAPTDLTGAELQEAQRERNQALLAYVAAHQPCDFAELMALFGPPAPDGSHRLQFQKRLSYLVLSGRLRTVNLAGLRHWELPEVAPTLATATALGSPAMGVGSPIAQQTCALTPIDVTPPRQFDVMHAPPYVPQADTALRPGAQDHRRYASRGDRC